MLSHSRQANECEQEVQICCAKDVYPKGYLECSILSEQCSMVLTVTFCEVS